MADVVIEAARCVACGHQSEGVRVVSQGVVIGVATYPVVVDADVLRDSHSDGCVHCGGAVQVQTAPAPSQEETE